MPFTRAATPAGSFTRGGGPGIIRGTGAGGIAFGAGTVGGVPGAGTVGGVTGCWAGGAGAVSSHASAGMAKASKETVIAI